jgi:hypothetical protein
MAVVFAFIPLSVRPARGSRRSGASKEKKTKESGRGAAGRVERNPDFCTIRRKELHALALIQDPQTAWRCASVQTGNL